MKKLLIILLVLTSSFISFGQVDNYRADLDFLFGALDKTKPGSGYLAPYGIDAIDKDDFNGILADSNTVNSLDLFRFIYADLFTAKFNPAAVTMPAVESLNTSLQLANANDLAIFYANYNEFREDALQQNLLRYQNGRLYDALIIESKNSFINKSPYTSKKLFIASSIAQVYTNTVTLRYNPAIFMNNTTATVQNVWINFGNGYIAMTPNTDYSNTYTDSTGYHRIAIKAQMSNGDIVETYTAVMVRLTNAMSLYQAADLGNPSFVIPADANQNGCRVYIRRSVATPGNQILRPFIVAEGLDIHDGAPAIDKTNYNVNDLITEWNNDNFNGQSINFNFDNIGHYDLIFIDWNNGVDDIRRNAVTMEMVINTINSMKTGNEQNVVMGISMGGLVARYCLADMTKHNRPTQTRLLITHDSPHQGAYVPLSFQHMVTGMQNKTILGIRLGAIGGFIDQGVQLLNKPATQQQLIMTSADENGTVHFNSFLNDIYRPMVTFLPTDPQPQYHFVATSMGSQCGIGTMPVGGNLAYGEAQVSVGGPGFILSAGLFSRFRLKISLNAKGLQGNNQGNEILYFRWRRESSMFFGVVNTSKTFIELHRNEPTGLANPIPWESVPAGVVHLDYTNQTAFDGGLSMFSLGFLGVDARFQMGKQFSFVPTISALDVVNPAAFTSSTIFNFVANRNTPANTFRPERIIAQERFFGVNGFDFNRTHTLFTSRNSRFIFNEMQQVIQPVECDDFCTSTVISGASEFCTSGVYSINGLPNGATVTWIATPAGIVNFIPNNSSNPVTLNAIGNGLITLSANIFDPCTNTNYTVTKDIKVGNVVDAYYNVISNYVSTYNNPFIYATGSVWQPANQNVLFMLSLPPGQGLSSVSWTATGTYDLFYDYGIGGCNIYMKTPNSVPYSRNSAYVTLHATGPCGPINYTYTMQAIVSSGFAFAVSPNPSSDVLSIKEVDNNTKQVLAKTNIQKIEVVDKTGVVVYRKEYAKGSPNNFIIPVSQLRTDVYAVRIFNGILWKTDKVIVQH